MTVSYNDLINKNGTIYNVRTGQGYSSPTQLAAALGVPASSIQWNTIQSNPNWTYQAAASSPSTTQPTNSTSSTSVSYANLVNKNGTIYNTKTGQGYPTPDALAKALGVPASSIQWNSIQSNPNWNFSAAAPAAPSPTGASITGDPTLDALYGRLDKMIQDQAASGSKFNPNIELTPAVIKQFLDQATNEVEPYYRNQINLIKGDLHNNLDNLQKNYDIQKRQNENQFKQDLSNKRETLAGQGLSQSGFRGQQEQSLATDNALTQEQAAANASAAAKNAVLAAEGKIGSRNIDTLGSFSQYAPTLSGGGSFAPTKTLNFGPTGGVTGSLEYSQAGDVRSLSDFLKSQEVQKRSLNFA